MLPEVQTRNIRATVRQFGATHWEGTGIGIGTGVDLRNGGTGGWSSQAEGVEALNIIVPGLDSIARRLPPAWQSDDGLDRLCIVLHTVLERPCLGDQTDDFAPISERRLSELVGREFAGRTLRLLSDPKVEVLETDNRCTPGKKCRGYRLRDEVVVLEPSYRWIPPKLAAKISLAEARHSRVEVGENPSHRLLWQSLCGLKLSQYPDDLLPPKSADPEMQLKHHAWRLAVDRVVRQRWHFSSDRRTGRVFNNFTSLPKLLRPYALLDRRPCAEIDIRNSQPFFMAALYPSRSCPWHQVVGLPVLRSWRR
jgi:hypothetical protein